MRIYLPKGLRLELVDNDNYTIPVGTRMTVVGKNECVDTESFSSSVWVVLDDDNGISSFIEFSKCKIIGDNFKKTFKPSKENKQ